MFLNLIEKLFINLAGTVQGLIEILQPVSLVKVLIGDGGGIHRIFSQDLLLMLHCERHLGCLLIQLITKYTLEKGFTIGVITGQGLT
jgi:hypothetical protein